MILEIPPGAKTMELKTSTMWFGDDGILYSMPRVDAPLTQTTEEIIEEMKLLRNWLGGRKVCLIAESNSKAASPPKSQRDMIAHELETVIKALAIISTSPLSRMVANLFFSFKPPKYPLKMFSNEVEAKNWIKQYL
jgi:hypothetical protein